MRFRFMYLSWTLITFLYRPHHSEFHPFFRNSAKTELADQSNFRHFSDSLLNSLHTKHLIVITTDGLRWQELYQGADAQLLSNPDFVSDTALYREEYWAETPDERRAILLPFLWNTFAQNGQLYGNRQLGNNVNTANGMWFSYPGYNEMFTGSPDDMHIFSNAKWTNPNENVFEFLNKKPELNGQVAAFATWDAFSAILREKKAGFKVQCGKECAASSNPAQAAAFGSKKVPPDFHTWSSAMDHLKTNRPRLMFIGLDDTDSRAHEGHYDLYLDAAHRFDSWLADLWQFVQNDPEYSNNTTILLTTDHGRGNGRQWTDHSMIIKGSDAIWMAQLAPIHLQVAKYQTRPSATKSNWPRPSPTF